MPAADLVRLHQDSEPPLPAIGGHVMIDRVTPEAMRTFVALTGPGSGSPFLSSEVRHLGGAAGRPARGAGALSHLDGEGAMFVVEVPMDPGQGAMIAGAVKRVEAGMAPFGHGRLYRNFVEEPVSASAFHATPRHERLREVRRRFDPATRIRTNHPSTATWCPEGAGGRRTTEGPGASGPPGPSLVHLRAAVPEPRLLDGREPVVERVAGGDDVEVPAAAHVQAHPLGLADR